MANIEPEILIPGHAIRGPAGNRLQCGVGLEQGIAAESCNNACGGSREKMATAHELPYKLSPLPVN